MDIIASRPTITTIGSSSLGLLCTSATPFDRQFNKVLRQKLFMLGCEKLATIRQTSANSRDALRCNLGILSVCRRARSSEFYAVEECRHLLSPRERNSISGPLYARRSASVSPSAVPVPTATNASFPPAFENNNNNNNDNKNTVSSLKKSEGAVAVVSKSPESLSPSKPQAQLFRLKLDEVVEYAVQDSARPYESSDGETDSEIEEAGDALDVFFMDEDGASMVRKRKNRRSEESKEVAEKRHCEEESVAASGVRRSGTAPIPIPQRPKPQDQIVLDTLVPLRGFFQMR